LAMNLQFSLRDLLYWMFVAALVAIIVGELRRPYQPASLRVERQKASPPP
jgi:hypothetical protein